MQSRVKQFCDVMFILIFSKIHFSRKFIFLEISFFSKIHFSRNFFFLDVHFFGHLTCVLCLDVAQMRMYNKLQEKKRDKREAKRQEKMQKEMAMDNALLDLMKTVKGAFAQPIPPQQPAAVSNSGLIVLCEIWDILDHVKGSGGCTESQHR